MSTCNKYYSIYIIHYTQLFLYYFHKFEIVSNKRATTIYTIIQFNLINLKLNKKKEIKLGKRERERKKREEKSN